MTKRCRKLTKEQKKLVYAPPQSNAGAGWIPERGPHGEAAQDAFDRDFESLFDDPEDE